MATRFVREGLIEEYRAHLQVRLEERGIPEHLQPGLLAYFTERRPVGGFLTACLCDHLSIAVVRADDESVLALKGIVEFLYWHAPATAWGSPERVQAWLADTSPVPTPFD